MNLEPAEWEQDVEEELSDAEKAILAEGEKLAAKIRSETLKVRKSKLVEEIEQIEQQIEALLGPAQKASEHDVEPAPSPEAGPEPEDREEPAEEPSEPAASVDDPVISEDSGNDAEESEADDEEHAV